MWSISPAKSAFIAASFSGATLFWADATQAASNTRVNLFTGSPPTPRCAASCQHITPPELLPNEITQVLQTLDAIPVRLKLHPHDHYSGAVGAPPGIPAPRMGPESDQ